jgi:hypothetical protein
VLRRVLVRAAAVLRRCQGLGRLPSVAFTGVARPGEPARFRVTPQIRGRDPVKCRSPITSRSWIVTESAVSLKFEFLWMGLLVSNMAEAPFLQFDNAFKFHLKWRSMVRICGKVSVLSITLGSLGSHDAGHGGRPLTEKAAPPSHACALRGIPGWRQMRASMLPVLDSDLSHSVYTGLTG